MTREEKEHIGKYVLELAKLLEDGCYQQEILLGAAHIIYEALEQEPILDKIRAEINNLTVYYTTKDKGINLISQNAVNRILDKYKAESENP